jgi:uncharacterized membrane protein
VFRAGPVAFRRRGRRFVAPLRTAQHAGATMPGMDRTFDLIERQPLVALHLGAALLALVIGGVVLRGRKGTPCHRLAGWAWVALMTTAAAASAFIRDRGMPNIAGYTPIHLFTLLVAVQLPLAVWHARNGRIEAHRKAMRGLFWGAGVVAGVFALLPGRFLGQLLWRDALGWLA